MGRANRRVLFASPDGAISGSMKRPILIHPDPRLKKTAATVDDVSDELRALADDMLETM